MGARPDDFAPSEFLKRYKSRRQRCGAYLFMKIWKTNPSASLIFKIPGYYGGLYLHHKWLKRIQSTNLVHKQVWTPFVMQASLRHATLDRCLTVVFEFGGYGVKPLQALIRQTDVLQQKPFLFVYGAQDFMDKKFAHELVIT